METSRVVDAVARIRAETGPGVALVAVTKGHDVSAWSAAVVAGCDGIGENYAQELRDKGAVALAEGVGPLLPIHFVGRIQTNKVRLVADLVSLWQSVDRESVCDEIARRAPGARVLLQVDTTGEESKAGCAPGEVGALLDVAVSRGLRCEGLMTIGPTDAEVGEIRTAFRSLRRLVDELGLEQCSMGMSGDWRIAVDEGATIVRLGTALFGARSLGGTGLGR